VDISKAICPGCSRPMNPTACECTRCRIRMEGDFSISPLAALPTQDQALMIAFVRSYGSIKRIQEILGVSYPTARARIDRIIENLNTLMTGPADLDATLEQLARGEISFSQAMERL
jgi:hypothetical protein